MPLPVDLGNLPPGALRPLAAYYAALARQLHAAADDYAHGRGNFAQVHQEIGSARAPADMMQQYIVNGLTTDAAARAVAQITGEHVDTITWAWRHKFNAAEKERRAQRMARVYRYYNLGLTPAQVAKITGTPVSTVRDWIKSAA